MFGETSIKVPLNGLSIKIGEFFQLNLNLPRHSYSNPCLAGDTDVVNGQLVFINVMILLKDVVEVPDLDAPVQAGGDDAVISASSQRDHVQDSLEMS